MLFQLPITPLLFFSPGKCLRQPRYTPSNIHNAIIPPPPPGPIIHNYDLLKLFIIAASTNVAAGVHQFILASIMPPNYRHRNAKFLITTAPAVLAPPNRTAHSTPAPQLLYVFLVANCVCLGNHVERLSSDYINS